MRIVLVSMQAFLLLSSTISARAEKVILVAGGESATLPSPAIEAKLDGPFGVDLLPTGNLVVVEMLGGRILSIDPKGIMSLRAGVGGKGFAGDEGPAQEAKFNGPHNLIVDKGGNIFIADTWNNRIRRIDPRNRVTTFAGKGTKGFSGDGGAAAQAEFGGIYCIAFDPSQKHLYLADLDNRRIRAIDMDRGIVTTIAGNGESGVPKDGGEAEKSPLVDPRAVAADDKGNIYILERKGNALRVVDASGKIRTLVGPKVSVATDEEGRNSRSLKGPKHLCIDREGDVIIADSDNHQIRKYIPSEKKLVTLAGTGKAGSQGLGGPPREVELNQPHGVFVAPDGTLYIADSTNHRVLKVTD
jgi:sugar lactone lactonase YvrE